MKRRFLVTTADERTWPADQPILFLGEWCRLYNRKEAWQNLDAEVVPYHWDDRQKFHRDYIYLRGLYEELLHELVERLNSIHNVEHSLRYWRILIGPWLGYFVQMLFDRWVMVEQAVSNYNISGVRVLDIPAEQLIPNDTDHFNKLFIDDPWNEMIYGQLLQEFTAVPIDKHQCSLKEENTISVLPVSSASRRLKSKLASAVSRVSQVFCRDDDFFTHRSYLSHKQDFLLQLRMGQIPKLWRPHSTPKAEIDWAKRRWKIVQSEEKDFSTIVRTMIPRHIPALYLEGYGLLQERCTTLPWPKRPPVIFTSNSHNSDDVFKAWAADKVEGGVALAVGQHGGSYGMALWNFNEDHEITISDKWLSWGWDKPNNDKIEPVCNFKTIGRRLSWNPQGGALMVEMMLSRYSDFMFSSPISSQLLDYFEEQFRFVATLPQDLRRQLLVRLFGYDYGWCQRERWKDRFADIRLDDGVVPIKSLIKKSRLYIVTYNATTFLESLGMNVPTIIFWNPIAWNMRSNVIPYFDRLKDAGIFHDTPESAAAKMVEVWDDVSSWWNQSKIQKTRQYFCDQFSRTVGNPIQLLKETLTNVASQT